MKSWPTKKLGEVLEKYGIIPAKIKRDEYRESGKYPVVDQGENLIAGYIDDEQKLYRGKLPVVIFGDHTRILKYIDFPFAFGADGIKILRPQEILLPKFFYYSLIFNPVANQGYKRHFSILTQTEIPLPPLNTQKEIVGRLDKIAEAQKLNDALIQKTDELFQSLLYQELNPAGPADASTFVKTSADKKAVAGKKDWEVKKIREICEELFAGGDVPRNNFSKIKTEKYSVPIFANGVEGKDLYGYTNIKKVIKPSITISARGTIGYPAIRTEAFFPIVRLIVLVPNSKIIDLYFLYYAARNFNFFNTGTSMPQLTIPMIERIKIQIPPLNTQKQIVAKLSAVHPVR